MLFKYIMFICCALSSLDFVGQNNDIMRIEVQSVKKRETIVEILDQKYVTLEDTITEGGWYEVYITVHRNYLSYKMALLLGSRRMSQFLKQDILLRIKQYNSTTVYQSVFAKNSGLSSSYIYYSYGKQVR